MSPSIRYHLPRTETWRLLRSPSPLQRVGCYRHLSIPGITCYRVSSATYRHLAISVLPFSPPLSMLLSPRIDTWDHLSPSIVSNFVPLRLYLISLPLPVSSFFVFLCFFLSGSFCTFSIVMTEGKWEMAAIFFFFLFSLIRAMFHFLSLLVMEGLHTLACASLAISLVFRPWRNGWLLCTSFFLSCLGYSEAEAISHP